MSGSYAPFSAVPAPKMLQIELFAEYKQIDGVVVQTTLVK